MKYKYKEPKGKRHVVSMRKWNKTFARRGRWPFVVAHVYIDQDYATAQFLPSVIGKLTILALSPLIYMIGGFVYGIKDAHGGVADTLFCKSRGAFSSDIIYKSKGDGWDRLMRIVGQ